MYSKEEILNFIKHFQNEGTIKTFTEGCCYWFAKILDDRFNFDYPEDGIYYNEIDNHFATAINTIYLYDITGYLGDIRKLNGWTRWYDFMKKDPSLVERIFRDCIDF